MVEVGVGIVSEGEIDVMVEVGVGIVTEGEEMGAGESS
jgi:hypothetical protein